MKDFIIFICIERHPHPEDQLTDVDTEEGLLNSFRRFIY